MAVIHSRDLLWGLIACSAFSACGGHSTPRRFPIPEDAANPIEIEFRGATGSDVVPIIAAVCADLPIPTSQVDRGRGYVETRWVDIADYETLNTAAYPLRERQVVYVFQIGEGARGARKIVLSALYQPNRPAGSALSRNAPYDRLVPIRHPAYQLALQLENRLRQAMLGAGILVVEGEKVGSEPG